MKFLFILYYIILPIMARIEVFDNTLHPDNLTITPNNSSCVFQSSNHFVLKTVDASAKMYLTSTNIFNQLLNQLDFLPELQPGNMEIDGTSWSTVANFPDVFRYTQLLEIDWTNRLEMCNPFLWLKSGNSTVCKLQSRLEFDDLSCSKLVGTLFTKYAVPNNYFADQLSKLDTETVYTVVQKTEKLISFQPIVRHCGKCRMQCATGGCGTARFRTHVNLKAKCCGETEGHHA